MIKFYCDKCGEEIKDTTEVGNFKIQERTFAFIKHQKADQIKATEYIFCVDCARKIRSFFQEPIKEESNGGDNK